MSILDPTPEEIRQYRKVAKLSQSQAATLVGLRSRIRWVEYESGTERPSMARWMCFLLLTDQHPYWRLIRRESG